MIAHHLMLTIGDIPPVYWRINWLTSGCEAHNLKVIEMIDNRYLRLNQMVLDFSEVECIEWKRVEEEFSSDTEQYSLRFHLRSGKCFTRQVQETQFKEVKGKYKEILKEGEE